MKIALLTIFSLLSVYGFSQTSTPLFKKGTKLKYDIVTNEGTLPLTVSVDSLSPSFIKYKWTAPNIGSGTWLVKEKSLESANSGRWSQLEPDAEVTLPDDQSVGMLSKAQWKSIQQDKKLMLDMVNYTLKKLIEPSKLNNKEVDALYLESDNASSKIWILNNSTYPAILKLSGNSAGPDIELKNVE
jgi:hypothetical protein